MNNTRENVIKLLQAKYDNNRAIAKMALERKNSEMYNDYMTECMAIHDAINLLTDRKYFNDMYEIYKRKIEG